MGSNGIEKTVTGASNRYILNEKLIAKVRHNYTPGIYAEGYIVFVFPFVCSSVRMFVSSFVRSYFRHVRGICVKVLR